jgi:hypothetical protein
MMGLWHKREVLCRNLLGVAEEMHENTVSMAGVSAENRTRLNPHSSRQMLKLRKEDR